VWLFVFVFKVFEVVFKVFKVFFNGYGRSDRNIAAVIIIFTIAAAIIVQGWRWWQSPPW
jgi:hypothetical protein